MALTPLNLTPLKGSDPIVDRDGRPTIVFLRFINGAIRGLQNGLNGIEAALNAAGIATAAAATATSAAAAATAAAESNALEQALINSFVDPSSVVSATPTDIIIAGHNRVYADATLTTVAVTGATVPHTYPAATDVYVSYVDPGRTGGAVSFILSTTPPTQTNDTHVVGAVTIPAAGTQAGGDGPRRPGEVIP